MKSKYIILRECASIRKAWMEDGMDITCKGGLSRRDRQVYNSFWILINRVRSGYYK